MDSKEMMEAMDAAALLADRGLRELPQAIAIPVARWFKENYLKAGHKRLGRILVAYAKDTDNIKPENYV